jgi:uncharacterized protein YaeQ
VARAAVLGDEGRVALPSILHRFEVQLSHVDKGVEQQLSISAARHPSETLERLWLRVLAWLWQWEEGISFGPGLCEPDEPDAYVASPRGGLSLLVRVGKPEPERIDREVSRNSGARVAVLFDSPKRLAAFVEESRTLGLTRVGRAELAAVDSGFLAALAADDSRRAKVSVTIVGDHVYVIDAGGRALDSPIHRAVLQ